MVKTFVEGCSGFGDSIYLRVIVEWLLEHRPETEYVVKSKFPEMFQDLNVSVVPHLSPQESYINCSYLERKEYGDTNQFQDMCINGGLPYIPYRSKLVNRVPENYVIALPLYAPMNGSPESACMMPFHKDYEDLLNKQENVLIIHGKHSFWDLVRFFNSAKMIICQQGWGVALAEALDVPLQAVFTERMARSKNPFIKSITPTKTLIKKTSKAVVLP